MTTSNGSSRAASRGNAQGAAAACLGVLLLGGTLSWQWFSSGPAFPSRLGAVAEAEHASASGERPTTGGDAHRAVPEATPRIPPSVPLDINLADGEALQALPGVGPGLAQRIVAYRESHGPFRRAEDLRDVPGIGAKRYARLQRWVRAESP